MATPLFQLYTAARASKDNVVASSGSACQACLFKVARNLIAERSCNRALLRKESYAVSEAMMHRICKRLEKLASR
eukprot:4893410-Amphidinium_carterae.1